MNILIHNEAEMVTLAKKLAADIQPGDCIALHGELGAGKSFLSRAMMRELGVTDEALPSPTFAIIQEYQAAHGLAIAHMDWYRLDGEQEVDQLGVIEFFEPPWVSFIEWSERAPSLLPEQTTHIYITLDFDQPAQRVVEVKRQFGSPEETE